MGGLGISAVSTASASVAHYSCGKLPIRSVGYQPGKGPPFDGHLPWFTYCVRNFSQGCTDFKSNTDRSSDLAVARQCDSHLPNWATGTLNTSPENIDEYWAFIKIALFLGARQVAATPRRAVIKSSRLGNHGSRSMNERDWRLY